MINDDLLTLISPLSFYEILIFLITGVNMSKNIELIQISLMKSGYNPGVIDGVWGRNTIDAVKKFQKDKGLNVDGIVGEKTASILFSDPQDTTSKPSLIIPWFEEAKRLVGTKEFVGAGSNPIIMEWSDSLDIRYNGDDVPWCGLFVAHCIGASLPEEVLPGNPLGARQWEKFGKRITPSLGAIMVFWRESMQSGKGHVGFYMGEDQDAYQILGGNQSDAVCLTWVNKNRFLNAHWPLTASALNNAMTITKQRTEGLSRDEA